jgi:hypothetical protein
MTKIGEKLDPSKIVKERIPVLFQVQPEGYVRVETHSDIKDWEDRLKNFYGIDAKTLGKIVPLDTCSGGCADDCGY